MIVTIAGNGQPGHDGDGGPALAAQLGTPAGVAVAPDGAIYFAEYQYACIRRVHADGTIITIAGRAEEEGYAGDGGPATDALLQGPDGLAILPDGSVCIADSGNDRIRVINPNGIIRTIAGAGESGYSGDGGPATQATFLTPYDVALGPDGSLYIADTDNFCIRRVDPSGRINTIAGTGVAGYSGDGGPATAAQLNRPFALALSRNGSLYVADYSNSRVRRIRSDGTIETVAGTGTWGYDGDDRPATLAALNGPIGIAVGPDDEIYIADNHNHRVRVIKPDGRIGTVAGSGQPGYAGDGGPPAEAQLQWPAALVFDQHGHLYVADSGNNRIRRISANALGTGT
jgi:sugar lactone lactonase YvrE